MFYGWIPFIMNLLGTTSLPVVIRAKSVATRRIVARSSGVARIRVKSSN